MLKAAKRFVIALVCFCSIPVAANARDLRISLPCPLAPLVESKDKGILVELVKAMAEEYKEGKITWDVYPFPRSVDNVEKGKADVHMPLIPSPKLRHKFTSEVLFKTVFALYTNKNNKEINPSNVSKYKIEAEAGGTDLFDFPVVGSPSIESSLQKLNIGRIDGVIFAMPETDMALRKLGLKNIKRWEYKKYDVRAIVPQTEDGKVIDKIFSQIIGKLKTTGKYQKIMGPILNLKYDDWQM